MEDDELAALLKRHRPKPPQAPRTEWASITAALEKRSPWWGPRAYVWLLGGSLGFASMALFLIQAPRRELAPDEKAGSAEFLNDAGSVLDVKAPALSKPAGEPYFELLERAN